MLITLFSFSSTLFNSLNPLPDDKSLGLPKLKAFADDKLNVSQNIKVVFHRIEKHCGYKHLPAFSFPHNVFRRCFLGKEENATYQKYQKSSLCGKGLILISLDLYFELEVII